MPRDPHSHNINPEGPVQRPKRRSVDLRQFLKMELPPREMILDPWLPTQAIAMVVGFRGVGKTHVGLGMGHAIATGGNFLRWATPKPRTVLYIDGEMAADDVQTRLLEIEVSSGVQADPDRFRLITPDLWGGPMPDLSTPEGQEAIEPELDGVDVVFIDNVSCLCRTGAENERESWLPVQDWALGQRRKGKTVIFLHHVNKNGNQRGTSGREDTLDAVLYLDRPGDYTIDQGCRFIARFDKARIRDASKLAAFEARLISHPNGYSVWSWDETAPSKAATTPKLGPQQLRVLNALRSYGTEGVGNKHWQLKSLDMGVKREATFYAAKSFLLKNGLADEIVDRFFAT